MVAVLEGEIGLAAPAAERFGLFVQVKVVQVLVDQPQASPPAQRHAWSGFFPLHVAR